MALSLDTPQVKTRHARYAYSSDLQNTTGSHSIDTAEQIAEVVQWPEVAYVSGLNRSSERLGK